MQPSNHHHTVADGAQARADFTNRRELRLCPRRFGMLNVVRSARMWSEQCASRGSCVVAAGGYGARQMGTLGFPKIPKNLSLSSLFNLGLFFELVSFFLSLLFLVIWAVSCN
ncbi:hypothetical protein E1A91_A08G073400v1 [Gossypium mustelinum]|uniref:Uncharacterized protein n=2 Tax=Gossypium TaxID=3633 RepID=A0A5J5UQ01_GOSBA|nr:hypothetical protein ES319_A08G069400v1 [Gossypium barbadense]TYJ21597.1 hypothetical protein E1A91_A08G073400v1 [Gossypium mustelinum]